MTGQRRGQEPARNEEADGESTAEQMAFVGALREEFNARFTQRGFARDVEGVDHSSLSRYLSGARTVPEWFIDRLYEQAHQQGRPFSSARRDELKRLRAAALGSSRNVNHRLQRSVEELQADLRDMTVRWSLEREHGQVQQHLRAALLDDRRALLTRLEQLQHDLASACEDLVRAEADQERANVESLRQLRAASDYVRDLQSQLESSERQGLEMARTIHGLEHELTVLRRQVPLLHQQHETKAPRLEQAGHAVAGPATPSQEASPTRSWPWWLAANVALLGSLLLFFAGMGHVENVRHLTVVDVLFPAGGLLALLFIATPLLGHAVTKDGGDAGLGDSDDVVYGYYPMM